MALDVLCQEMHEAKERVVVRGNNKWKGSALVLED